MFSGEIRIPNLGSTLDHDPLCAYRGERRSEEERGRPRGALCSPRLFQSRSFPPPVATQQSRLLLCLNCLAAHPAPLAAPLASLFLRSKVSLWPHKHISDASPSPQGHTRRLSPSPTPIPLPFSRSERRRRRQSMHPLRRNFFCPCLSANPALRLPVAIFSNPVELR